MKKENKHARVSSVVNIIPYLLRPGTRMLNLVLVKVKGSLSSNGNEGRKGKKNKKKKTKKKRKREQKRKENRRQHASQITPLSNLALLAFCGGPKINPRCGRSMWTWCLLKKAGKQWFRTAQHPYLYSKALFFAFAAVAKPENQMTSSKNQSALLNPKHYCIPA